MKKNKNHFIEFYRFIAMFMIMAHHLYHLGATNYPFKYGWIFVEFFFILTGYLTTNHFCKCFDLSSNEKMKNSIFYTIKKFLSFIPFVWLAVIIEYGIEIILNYKTMLTDISGTISWLSDFPFELLLIGSSYTKPELVPLWYLSAMFLVFPIFCILLQQKNKYFVTIVSFIIPIIYYGTFGVADNWIFPLNLCRAFSAMLLGTFSYYANDYLFENLYSRINKKYLTIIELLCFLFPIVACYKGAQYVLRIIVLCFVIGITISMSGKSATFNIKSKFMDYLGKITMPIYLFHWIIGGLIGYFLDGYYQEIRIILYYLLSIFVSITIFELYKIIKNKLLKKYQKNKPYNKQINFN